MWALFRGLDRGVDSVRARHAVGAPSDQTGTSSATTAGAAFGPTPCAGSGFTTVKGFWIPEEPAATEPADGAERDGANSGTAAATGAPAVAGGDAPPPQHTRPGRGGGRGRGRGRGRGGRGGHPRPPPPSAAERAAAAAAAAAPPTKVELMPMPEGLHDEIPVVCCGRRALLHVRTQRVVYNETLMAVSHFEKICGRGDAKKWKSSLWWVDGGRKVGHHGILPWCFGASDKPCVRIP